jgi:hypothetical protein
MVVRVGGEIRDTRDGGGWRAIKSDALPQRDGARMRADEIRDEGDHGILHGVHPPAAARPRPSNRRVQPLGERSRVLHPMRFFAEGATHPGKARSCRRP